MLPSRESCRKTGLSHRGGFCSGGLGLRVRSLTWEAKQPWINSCAPSNHSVETRALACGAVVRGTTAYRWRFGFQIGLPTATGTLVSC